MGSHETPEAVQVAIIYSEGQKDAADKLLDCYLRNRAREFDVVLFGDQEKAGDWGWSIGGIKIVHFITNRVELDGQELLFSLWDGAVLRISDVLQGLLQMVYPLVLVVLVEGLDKREHFQELVDVITNRLKREWDGCIRRREKRALRSLLIGLSQGSLPPASLGGALAEVALQREYTCRDTRALYLATAGTPVYLHKESADHVEPLCLTAAMLCAAQHAAAADVTTAIVFQQGDPDDQETVVISEYLPSAEAEALLGAVFDMHYKGLEDTTPAFRTLMGWWQNGADEQANILTRQCACVLSDDFPEAEEKPAIVATAALLCCVNPSLIPRVRKWGWGRALAVTRLMQNLRTCGCDPSCLHAVAALNLVDSVRACLRALAMYAWVSVMHIRRVGASPDHVTFGASQGHCKGHVLESHM